jgi:SAM-dependent methyltransferase
MVAESAGHWERIYRTKSPTEVSWYEPAPEISLALIGATGVGCTAPIIDVGAGASQLVDHLVADGYRDVTVLDIAPAALALARARLGPTAAQVVWVVSDVTAFQPERRYHLWHDRAAFHFLMTGEERARYLRVVEAALAPGGHLVLATFGPEGPRRCSGLPVQRYSTEDLGVLLGPGFRLRRSELQDHPTPAGQSQQFLWSWWQATT